MTAQIGVSRASEIKAVSIHDVPANRKRGGDIRTILSPATVGATAGFMGTLLLQPGEVVTEHWHPYSEEFVFCVRGQVRFQLEGEERALMTDEGILIPLGIRHRLINDGVEPAFLVFLLGPLAPAPHLGHVDTEPLPGQPEGATG